MNLTSPERTPQLHRARALALALTLAIASPLVLAADGQDIEKVNGAVTAEAGRTYGDVTTVNGSVTLEDGARVEDAETVNGSVRAGDNIEARSLATVNGRVAVGTQARIDGGIETVNGSVFVDRGGRLGKGVATVNGSIGLVATELGGGIETVGGDITVGIDSHVHGGIHVEKPNASWMPIHFGNRQRPPRIIIGPNATVDGDLVFERDVQLYVHKTARIGTVTGATPVTYDTARAPQESAETR